MLDVELLAKHAARVALASSETVVKTEKRRSGGAWMAIAGIGNAARIAEKETVVDWEFKKLETVSTTSKLVPPSSSSARSNGEATLLPRESKRAWMA